MKKRGFTLVELLVAISLLLVLMALLAGALIHVHYHAQIARTRAVIQQLETACRNYRVDHAAYPPGNGSARGLEGRLCGPRTVLLDGRRLPREPYLARAEFADAWGREIRYRSPGVANPSGVDVTNWD